MRDSEILKKYHSTLYYQLLEWKNDNFEEFNKITNNKPLYTCNFKTLNTIASKIGKRSLVLDVQKRYLYEQMKLNTNK